LTNKPLVWEQMCFSCGKRLKPPPYRKRNALVDGDTRESSSQIFFPKDNTSSTLIWSSDSRYLAYGLGPNDPFEEQKLTVQDIYTGEVWPVKSGGMVMEYRSLIGWSAIAPWTPVN
jgi:hypothetical protein